MPDMLLDIRNGLPAIGLVPAAVQLFGCRSKLDNEVPREVLGLGFAAFLLPKPPKGPFVVAHNDLRVRAAYEVPSFLSVIFPHVSFHWPSLGGENDVFWHSY